MLLWDAEYSPDSSQKEVFAFIDLSNFHVYLGC